MDGCRYEIRQFSTKAFEDTPQAPVPRFAILVKRSPTA